MKKIFYYLFSLTLFTSCNDNELLVDISGEDVEVQIKRFDQALFEQNVDNIESNLEKAEETKSTPVSGLADAIARAKRIKQEAIVPPKERAKQAEGVKKI